MSNLFGVKMSLWLKDRRRRTLSGEDILHYHKIVVTLAETMKTISFKTHVGEDGTLQISLPHELKNTDLEVTLVYQPISLKEKEEKTTFSQWQEGLFEEVIGGWEGELLVREKQPDYEERAIEND
ncbi:Similar to tr/Q8YK90/Q8YK90 (modular protein) [Microcystis aeruginosa PCC 9432]|uniref:Similar to tr/Q8YK90/Q8YK90 (Modular protein) n=2 Tax=Microcystaceae TaxID=1890449 RepID=A0A822L979_MICAE|nr:Similar to tr/Q8YK90/Q8YK90 (modular protein) [Microcystis aeruginosa PCC 9432]